MPDQSKDQVRGLNGLALREHICKCLNWKKNISIGGEM